MFYLKRKNIIKSGLVLILLLSFLFLFTQNDSQAATTSPDAIAIRVIPNSDHYSPLAWYKKNIKVQGSPQNLLVDGYEAVRDGRTVYVNAANISGNDFYTNIYIISYNQEAEDLTIDIFGQILAHWKFNAGETDPGKCSLTKDKECLYNSDCPSNEYCNSEKARIARDTIRLADLAGVKEVLENYRAKHGRYPVISAGSYIANATISTWPSWQAALGSELGITMPKDPINRLGSCPANYDKITCWDQKAKSFYDSDPADSALNLPNGSQGYVYTVRSDGTKYNSCFYAESEFINQENNGSCQDYSGEVEADSQTPRFTGVNLPKAYSGKSYEGYIEAIDPFGNKLTWSIAPKSGCDMWNGLALKQPISAARQRKVVAAKAGVGGICVVTITISNGKGGRAEKDYSITVINTAPTASDISDQTIVAGQVRNFVIGGTELNNQYPLEFAIDNLPEGFNYTRVDEKSYQIFGAYVNPVEDGVNIEKVVSVIVTDAYQGVSPEKTFTIKITNRKPIITPAPKDAIIGQNINHNIFVTDPDQSSNPAIDHYPLSFSVIGLPGGAAYATAPNRHDLSITGQVVDQTKVYNITAVATDKYSADSDSAPFTITVKNNPPVLPSALAEATGCVDYSFSLPENDADGHDIIYTIDNLPNNLSLADNVISGRPMVNAGNYDNINVNAKDEYYSQTIPPYNAEDNEIYTLKVNNEAFTINVITDPNITNDTIYVYPALVGMVYYGPVHYDARSVVSTSNPVTYSLVNQPSWLTIDQNSGVIYGAPSDNTSDPGDYTVTVKATNACGATATKPITIHVLKNEWAGDTICQAALGESCNNPISDCGACCGNGIVDSGEECDDANQTNGDGCNTFSANCQHVCGDGINWVTWMNTKYGGPQNNFLVNSQHTASQCAAASGTVVIDPSCNQMCKFSADSCTNGWTWYSHWSTTARNTVYSPNCSYDGWGSCSCILYNGSAGAWYSLYHGWSDKEDIETCTYNGSCSGCTHTYTTERTEIGCY